MLFVADSRVLSSSVWDGTSRLSIGETSLKSLASLRVEIVSLSALVRSFISTEGSRSCDGTSSTVGFTGIFLVAGAGAGACDGVDLCLKRDFRAISI